MSDSATLPTVACQLGMHVLLFYTDTRAIRKRKLKKKIPFKISSRMKYIRIDLTKKLENLYSENCKTIMKEIQDSKNK